MPGKEYPLSIILRTVDRATAGIRSVTGKLDKISKTVTKVGRGLTTNVTLPLVGIGAAAVGATGRFEQGMSNVSTLIDESKESLSAMSAEVLKIGSRVSVPLDQLTGGLYDVRSAGTDASKQFQVLENSARLAVAGLGTTQQSVDLVTSSINAFSLEGKDAQRVYDNIFKTVKNGKTTISGLAQGFGNVAGTVAETGTKLDEYLASVAALTTTGLPAAQAHTQLRAVISGLTRDTANSRKVFRQLGAKDFKDLIAKSGGLVPALEKITGALGGNTGKILKLVGSTEALNAIIGLTGAQNETFVSTLKDMRTGANALDEAFAKQSKTMTARWQRTKNALVAAGVALGRVLTPAINRAATALQGLANWFAGLDDDTKKWIVRIGAVLAVLGPALIIIGKVAAGLAVLGKVIAFVTTVVRILTAAMLANPIVLIITAIAVAALLIYRYWEPIKAFFGRLWEGVKHVFLTIFNWLKNVFLNYTPLGLIIKHWGPISKFFGKLWDAVTGVFKKAWEIITGIVDKIVGAAEKVKDVATGVFDAVTGREEIGIRGFVDRQRARNAAGAAGEKSRAEVKVKFENAPAGTRVESDRRSNADVFLDVGYQLGVL